MKHTPKGWDLTTLKTIFNNIYECALSGSPDKSQLEADYLIAVQKLFNIQIQFLLSKERERTLRQVDRLIEYEMTDYTLKDEPLVGIINMNDFQSLKKGEHEK